MGLTMREKAKRLQNVMLRNLTKFAFVLNHDERAALADGVALLGEMVEKLDNLERAVNGKNHNQ